MSMSIEYHFFLKSFRKTRWGAYRYWGVVRKSYASRVVDRIYDYYFAGAKNLKIEYWRYYRNEFASYEDYLIKRFNLHAQEAEKLDSYRAYYKELTFEEDEQIPQLMEDENIASSFKAFSGGVYI